MNETGDAGQLPARPQGGRAADGALSAEALRLHEYYHGKIETVARCPVRPGQGDWAVWYTPGVAAASRAVQQDPQAAYQLTWKGNSVAIVSDGTRVLGLGNIGPHAALPVMEGKALLFKYLGGIDAVPICLKTEDPDEFVRTVQLLEPSFGGINLEDIAQPKCFRILDTLRRTMPIPVWHDDQQGTATVILAGLLGALQVVGKRLDQVRIALIGVGAAGTATARLLLAAGADAERMILCDVHGILHRGRTDLRAEYPVQWELATRTNAEQRQGGIAEAMRGADVVVAASKQGPGTILPEWVRQMADDPIVFACANPIPEIWPDEARNAGAAVAGTARSDFPNQVNNSLVFPSIFRGALDVRARAITDGMCIAAARELNAYACERLGLRPDRILPTMDDTEVFPRVAAAVGVQAVQEGVAAVPATAALRRQLEERARAIMTRARKQVDVLLQTGVIPAWPSAPAERQT
ncbi:MAG: NADP-dependent malic enzyme [Limnochordaceae bacterium]|nr:NADP-dependent malic enzyme [Limnochordaceae bacterium]